jgi:rRNA maturation endonuclease Nob1
MIMKRKRNMCQYCKVGYVYENDDRCANCGKLVKPKSKREGLIFKG